MIICLKRMFFFSVIMLGMGVLSCGLYTWYEDANYFKEEGGIIIATPIKNTDGTWFLPIKFQTRKINSAHVFRDVKVCLDDNIIKIRALVGLAQSGNQLSKGANLGKLKDGIYQVKYLNHDGSTVDIGNIDIHN